MSHRWKYGWSNGMTMMRQLRSKKVGRWSVLALCVLAATSSCGDSDGDTGGSGASGPVTLNGAFAYVWGQFGDDIELAVVTEDGTLHAVRPHRWHRGHINVDTSVTISPDGKHIAVVGGVDGVDGIYLYQANGSGDPVPIATAASHPHKYAQIRAVSFSPDGKYISYHSDIAGNEDVLHPIFTAYVVPVAGGDPEPLGGIVTDENEEPGVLNWTDATHIMYSQRVAGVPMLQLVDVTGDTGSPTAVVTEAFGGFAGDDRTDTSGRTYFRHSSDRRLYRMNGDGSELEVVPGTELMGANGMTASIRTFRVSPDGLRLAFAAAAPTATHEVYVVDLSTDVVTRQSNASEVVAATATNSVAYLRWGSDGNTVVAAAFWPLGGQQESALCLFAIPATGAPALTRITAPDEMTWLAAPTFMGNRLVYTGDFGDDGSWDMFAMTDLTQSDQPRSDHIFVKVDAENRGMRGLVAFSP